MRILKTLIGHNTRTNQSLQRCTPAQWTEQQSHSALAVLRRRDRRFHLPCAPRLCRGLYGNLLSSVFKSHEKRATLLTLVFQYMHTLPQPMTTNCAVASPCAYGTGTALMIFCVVPSFEIAHDTARAQSGMCKSRQNRVTTRLTSGYTVPARTGRPVDVRRKLKE